MAALTCAAELLESEWLNGNAPKKVLDGVHGNLKVFNARRKLKARHAAPLLLLFCASVCAAPTLNATGESRVTLSLRQERLRAASGHSRRKGALEFVQSDAL